MNYKKKIKLRKIIFAGVIIIISFFYAVIIQPVVIGESGWFKTYAGLNKLENGFEYRGRIIHMNEEEIQKYNSVSESPSVNCYLQSYSSYIIRFLNISNFFYIISNDITKINSLDNLNEIDCVKLL